MKMKLSFMQISSLNLRDGLNFKDFGSSFVFKNKNNPPNISKNKPIPKPIKLQI